MSLSSAAVQTPGMAGVCVCVYILPLFLSPSVTKDLPNDLIPDPLFERSCGIFDNLFQLSHFIIILLTHTHTHTQTQQQHGPLRPPLWSVCQTAVVSECVTLQVTSAPASHTYTHSSTMPHRDLFIQLCFTHIHTHTLLLQVACAGMRSVCLWKYVTHTALCTWSRVTSVAPQMPPKPRKWMHVNMKTPYPAHTPHPPIIIHHCYITALPSLC